MMEKEILYLCRRDCCPSMSYNRAEDFLEITDDFGGKVNIKPEDFRKLAESFFKRFPKGLEYA